MTLRAQAADETAVMIVFDGSGSMWGKLDGGRPNKFRAARTAVNETLDNSNAKPRLGLAAFGNNRGSDCRDAGIVLEPAPFDPDLVRQELDGFSPRGRGPLTKALNETANQLAAWQGLASIIVLHDGLDNCQQDPCAFAAELAQSQPGVSVHTISIALGEEDLAAIRCLSEATGGKHFDAQDADAVNEAMKEAWALATLSGRSQSVARPAASSPANQPPPEAPFEGSGLLLSAALDADSEPLSDAVSWRVLPERQSAGKPVHVGTSAYLAVPLPAGRYIVEARRGLAQTIVTMEVSAGRPTLEGIIFNAGSLSITARAKRNGDPLDDVLITISKAATGKSAGVRGAPVSVQRNSSSPLVLPAGDYVVSLEQGMSRVERSVTVNPGSVANMDLVLNSGRLLVRAAPYRTAAPYEDTLFIVMEDDPDAPQGRREVARAAGPEASFQLATGTYTIMARTGAAQIHERIAVKAGELTDRTIVLNAARLQLTVKLGARPAPPSQPSTFKIVALDLPFTEPILTSRFSPRLAIAPGRYRVEHRIGLANALSAYEIEIMPGQQGKLAIKHKAGLIRFRLSAAPGGLALGNIHWQVTDASGRQIWQTGRPEPQDAFAEGRYTVRAEQRGRRFEKSFDVSAGDDKTVELLIGR